MATCKDCVHVEVCNLYLSTAYNIGTKAFWTELEASEHIN